MGIHVSNYHVYIAKTWASATTMRTVGFSTDLAEWIFPEELYLKYHNFTEAIMAGTRRRITCASLPSVRN